VTIIVESGRSSKATLRTTSVPNCPYCGQLGEELFSKLTDSLFNVPGEWKLNICPKKSCGLIWLDPVPIPEDLPKAYEHYYTHNANPEKWKLRAKYEEWLFKAVSQYRLDYNMGISKTFAFLLTFLADVTPAGVESLELEAMFLKPPRGSGRLMDFGCGNGERMRRMIPLGWNAEGLDMDPEAVKTALASGLVVTQGGIEALEHRKVTFEAIFMGHVLEHLVDPLASLQKITGALEKGGRLVLLTPNPSSFGSRCYGRHWRGWEPPRHLNLFPLALLSELVTRVGLRVEVQKTSAQGARYILGWSMALNEMKTRHRLGVTKRVSALILQLWERLILLQNPEYGEENLIIAVKEY